MACGVLELGYYPPPVEEPGKIEILKHNTGVGFRFSENVDNT
jgi:hypothetical protein